MRSFILIFWAALLFASCSGKEDGGLYFTHHSDRIDLFYNDRLITSYLFVDSLQKPVLYPVKGLTGTEFTRAYPLRQKAGESTDHPHHIGVWFTYGEVNGVDFWTSTWAKYDGVNPRYGRIQHVRAETAVPGKHRAVLKAVASWQKPDGQELIREKTIFHFTLDTGMLILDRQTTLVAQENLHFEDSKEGMYAVRVARELEQTPETKGYLDSEGRRRDEVWGQRAGWVLLKGKPDSAGISILFVDHPANVGYPTHWMARGYGLFGANPLGRAAYTEEADSLNFRLQEGDSVTFRYRMVFAEGVKWEEQAIDTMVREFVQGAWKS